MMSQRDNIPSQSLLIKLYDSSSESESCDSSNSESYDSSEPESYDSSESEYDDSSSEENESDIQEDGGIQKFGKANDEMMLIQVRKYMELNIVLKKCLDELKFVIDKMYENKYLKPTLKACRVPTYFLFKFNPPYFKDQHNFPSWLKNNDEKLRRKYGFMNYCEFIKDGRFKKWTIHDENIVFSFVQEQLFEQEILHLKSKERHLKRTVKSCDQLKVQLDKIGEEITQVRKKSFTELINDKIHSKFDWDILDVTQFNINRSTQECIQYWESYLSPSINKCSWSKREESDLMRLASKYNYQNWDKICIELGTNRSPLQTFLYFKIALMGFKKKSIKTQETNKITNINISFNSDREVQFHTVTENYAGSNVAPIIKRSKKSSKTIKGKFSKEEDLQILSGVDKFGSNFYMVASSLKNRSMRQVKFRYKRLVKKTTSGFWSLKEDNMLMKLVEKHGVGHWSKISKQFITNRDRDQLRHRYNILKEYFDKNGKLLNVIGFNKLRRQLKLRENVDKIKPDIKLIKLNSDSEIEEQEELKKIKSYRFWSKFTSEKQEKLISHYQSSHKLLSDNLNNFFQDYVKSYLEIPPQCKDNNISKLTSMTLYVLYYLNIRGMKQPTRTEIDGMNDPLKSVLTSIFNDKQSVETKEMLIKIKTLNETKLNRRFKKNSTTSLKKRIQPRKECERNILINNSYTLPMNVSTIMLLKMVYKNQIILQQNVSDEKIFIKKLPDNVTELQATHMFRKRFYNILKHTTLTLRKKSTNEEMPIKRIKTENVELEV